MHSPCHALTLSCTHAPHARRPRTLPATDWHTARDKEVELSKLKPNHNVLRLEWLDVSSCAFHCTVCRMALGPRGLSPPSPCRHPPRPPLPLHAPPCQHSCA